MLTFPPLEAGPEWQIPETEIAPVTRNDVSSESAAHTPPAPELHQRVITTLSAVGLMGAAFATWSTAVQLPLTGLVAAVGFIVAMTIVALALTTGSARRLAQLDVAVLGMAALILAGWAMSTLYFQPGYGTDEAAFTQFAAHLMVHGHDPYGANLLSALTQFRVPIEYATYTLSGHVVSTYGYPSLPILFTALFLPITHGVQTAIVAEVVALLVGMTIMFFVLPKSWRALAPLTVVGLPLLFGYSVSGVTAILMATLLIVVANRWSSTGITGKLGTGGLLRAGCLGLAIADAAAGVVHCPVCDHRDLPGSSKRARFSASCQTCRPFCRCGVDRLLRGKCSLLHLGSLGLVARDTGSPDAERHSLWSRIG